MNKKRAFTLIETLLSSGIFSMIMILGLSISTLVTWLLFTGQMESTNRTALNETMYYIVREIQSAEAIRIAEDGKTLEMKERGSSGYHLKYSLIEHYPVDYLAFQDKRLLDIEAENSSFSLDNGTVKIQLSIVKNNLETNQQGKTVEFAVKPRCDFHEGAD